MHNVFIIYIYNKGVADGFDTVLFQGFSFLFRKKLCFVVYSWLGAIVCVVSECLTLVRPQEEVWRSVMHCIGLP